MNKVAICLSGAMSKLKYGRLTDVNQLYCDNPYVNFKISFNSIKKHIINANPNYEFDFFIHSWNEDLADQLNELYKPKAYLYENNNLYSDMLLRKITNPSNFSNISKAFSMKKSIELMEDYKLNHNIKYDLIINYRADLFLSKDMLLDNYDRNLIYVNAYKDCMGDFHFIMNEENVNIFKYLFDSVDHGNEPLVHLWIKNYINNYMNKSIFEDDIHAGKDQEVLRKLYTSEENNSFSLKDLSNYE